MTAAKTNNFTFSLKGLLVFALLLLIGNGDYAFAQKGKQFKKPATQQPQSAESKDTGKVLIHILNNDYGEFIQGDGRAVQKLMYNVKIRYGSDTMYCDSAFFYTRENSVEAFGDVAVYQADGTQAFAEYMRYTSANQRVYMLSRNSDVELNDGKGNILWSKEVNYQLQSKTGSYIHGGTLQSGATVVSSEIGTYNLRTKNARFRKNVIISDPQYYIQSKNLAYNTQTKIVTFYDTSTVKNNASILKTISGYYNSIDSSAHFTDRSAIWNGSQFIEADTLDYNHRSGGIAKARGSVIALDTTRNIALFSQAATFKEKTRDLLAYGAPLLRTIHDKDSLYIKADTFFSAPAIDTGSKTDSLELARQSLQKTVNEIHQQIISPDSNTSRDTAKQAIPAGKDSINLPRQNIKNNLQSNVISLNPSAHKRTDTLQKITNLKPAKERDTAIPLLQHQSQFDSLQAGYHNQPGQKDTSGPRYFIGYHHVRIFSDSLQGYCDSIRYNQVDSLLRMYRKPLLWPNNSQVAGTEIYLKLDSSRIQQLIVPEEGILINRSGPEKAGLYNQIQGDRINGYFKKNQLHRLIAEPHAASIYYVTNDQNEYVGCSEASSRQIEILFDSSGKISKIYYRQDVKQKITPMKEVHPEEMRLNRFQWQEALRPKDLKSFLEDVTQPIEAVWKDDRSKDDKPTKI